MVTPEKRQILEHWLNMQGLTWEDLLQVAIQQYHDQTDGPSLVTNWYVIIESTTDIDGPKTLSILHKKNMAKHELAGLMYWNDYFLENLHKSRTT